jgi:hypothetical protein
VALGVVAGVTAGTATITYSVTNSCGTESAVKQVTVNPQPAKPVIGITHGVLFVPAVYASYQWLLNGVVIPGAVDDSSFAAAEGDYSVLVTNSLGCPVMSDTLSFRGCSADELNVFPNPAASVVQIQWCQKVTVRIFSVDGRHMFTEHSVKEIDLSQLAPGIYMLSIFDSDGKRIKTKRITKVNP